MITLRSGLQRHFNRVREFDIVNDAQFKQSNEMNEITACYGGLRHPPLQIGEYVIAGDQGSPSKRGKRGIDTSFRYFL